jgi:hypothetical protein
MSRHAIDAISHQHVSNKEMICSNQQMNPLNIESPDPSVQTQAPVDQFYCHCQPLHYITLYYITLGGS